MNGGIGAKVLRRIRDPFVPRTDWRPLVRSAASDWPRRVQSAKGRGPKVLIATSTGGHEAVTPVEGLLALALTIRGAEVHFLLCDGLLPACQMQAFDALSAADGSFSDEKKRSLCRSCLRSAAESYDPLGLPLHRTGALLGEDEIVGIRRRAGLVPADGIAGLEEDGVRLGEHATAGALRFFARGDLRGEALGETIIRRYLEAALLMKAAARRLFERERYDVSVFHHGIYVPQGVIGDVARAAGARVVNWNPAYRKRRLLFSHGDTYHHTLMHEKAAAWEGMKWDEGLDAQLDRYLESRRRGSEDWISFQHGGSAGPSGALFSPPGFSASKPTALLLTNVAWDARLHYPANAFPDMESWVFETIDFFGRRQDLQLVIRIHPAEVLGTPRSRQRLDEAIRAKYSALPGNVFVVGPEDRVSTYGLADRCDSALIYGTKTGVELAARGLPVIVAGEAWMRDKGIGFDASSAEEYRRLLALLPFGKRLDAATTERARKYAFHFFFRRMIPVEAIAERKGLWPPLRAHVRGLEDLAPGRDPGLDVICDGILSGSDFIYPEEVL